MLFEVLFAVTIAAALDTILFTGYFTYGGAIAAAASVAFLADAGKPEVFIAALLGVLVGEATNWLVTRFGKLDEFIGEKMQGLRANPRYGRLVSVVPKADDSLISVSGKYLALRFVAISRPMNVILLVGARGNKISDVLAVVFGSVIWVFFWVVFFDTLVSWSKAVFL